MIVGAMLPYGDRQCIIDIAYLLSPLSLCVLAYGR